METGAVIVPLAWNAGLARAGRLGKGELYHFAGVMLRDHELPLCI